MFFANYIPPEKAMPGSVFKSFISPIAESPVLYPENK